jgi:endo-1,4-beta-D-glucanase Y
MSRCLNKLNTTTIPGIIDDPERYLGSNYQEIIDFWIYCEKLDHEQIVNVCDNISNLGRGSTIKYNNLIFKLQPKNPIKPKDQPYWTDVYYLIFHTLRYLHQVYHEDYWIAVRRGTEELIIKQQLLDRGFQMVYTNLLDLNAMKRAAFHNLIVFKNQILIREESKMKKLKLQLESVPL